MTARRETTLPDSTQLQLLWNQIRSTVTGRHCPCMPAFRSGQYAVHDGMQACRCMCSLQ